MQTTRRATAKTETSTDRRLKAAVQHFLLLALSYSSKHFTLTLYGIKYLTLRHHCQVKTSAKCGDTKQRSFRELAGSSVCNFPACPQVPLTY